MPEMKTFTLECPDPDCEAEFTVEMGPEDLGDDAACILCPECGEEWEWELDEDGTLTLLLDEDDDPETEPIEDEEPDDPTE